MISYLIESILKYKVVLGLKVLLNRKNINIVKIK